MARMIDSIRAGSCSQLAPTASAPASTIRRAQSATGTPSAVSVVRRSRLMVATMGNLLSRAHSRATSISSRRKNVSRIRK